MEKVLRSPREATDMISQLVKDGLSDIQNKGPLDAKSRAASRTSKLIQEQEVQSFNLS